MVRRSRQYSDDTAAKEIETYPKQQAFLECQKPVKVFTGGRGCGKSKAGAIDMMLRSKANRTYMVVAPTYKMMDRSTLRSFREVAILCGVWDPDGYKVQERRLEGRNGAEYFFCSADDEDSTRGINASGGWFDEMQKAKEDAYINATGCLREDKEEPGWITATFTPGDPGHWTSKTFINGFVPAEAIVTDAIRGPITVPYTVSLDGDAACFRASLKENTFNHPDFYKRFCRRLASSPMRLLREAEGECVYMEGSEWNPDYFANCEFDEWPTPERGALKVISLDSSLGKEGKTGDYAAYVYCMWTNNLFYLDADLRAGLDASIIAQSGVEAYRTWKPHYFVVEEEMGQHLLIAEMHRIADELKIVMAITPMGTEKINKKVRIRRLTPYISRRQLRFKSNSPGAKLLREQLMAFPIGEHDDGPDSLEYNVRTLILATTGRILPPTVRYGNQYGVPA